MHALRTPDGPKELLCWPPAARWQKLVEENRARLKDWNFNVQGVPADRLRTAARRSVLALAGASSDAHVGQPLIVTGHQPQFYHPGIWMKAFVVTAEAKGLGGQGINLAVDHDAGELAAEIPWRDDSGLHTAKHYLVPPQAGRPLETLPAPTPEDVERFVVSVEDRLATLGEDVRTDLWHTFADGLRQVAGTTTSGMSAAEVGWRSRALYEETLGHQLIPDVPVSRISNTREFLLFFVHWAADAESLLKAYNRALIDFRTAHGVRSTGNPFPDLLIRPDGAVELPFWGLTEAGIRRKLYVQRMDDELVLTNLEGVFARIPAGGGWGAVDALMAKGAQVRPRAVPLTVYHRLFVADLFIHGTGGGRYDEVTDALIRYYFGVEPPRFAVVSATMQLPFGELPVQPSALAALRHKLRDLVWNPQRYAWEAAGRDDATDEQLAALVREKERLISEIGTVSTARPRHVVEPSGRGPHHPTGPAGSEKRALTRKIEAINARLYGLLGDVVQGTEEQLRRLTVKARSGSNATRRTYPFFLYDPEAMWALLKESEAGADDGSAVACCGVDRSV